MQDFPHMFQLQTRRMWRQGRFGILFLAMAIIVTLSFAETCVVVYGKDISNLDSAATGWIARVPVLNAEDPWHPRVFDLFLNFLLLPFGALVFADFYYTDQKSGMYPVLITRCSANVYHLSGALLCFLGAFLVITIPLLISQVLMFSLLPTDTTINIYMNGMDPLWQGKIMSNPSRILFPGLVLNHPYLANLMFIMYDGLLAASWALVSYVLSYFLRANRFLSLLLPTISILVIGFTANMWIRGFDLTAYTSPELLGYPKYPAVFFFYLLLPLIFSIAFLGMRLKKRKVDEL
ncbi:hypothetical protein [Faecalispora jeddahensis]|uniref:hypothetical protein n=1 Tax=Faecalispora jeddahensis TaxID=1414721 RepID=UPI0028A9D02A|nr:hypothetical protein [Faecalispora jeddahensis]